MAVITLKTVPEELHQRLRQGAMEDGRSLASYILTILQEAEDLRARRAAMQKSREELEAFVASMAELPDATDLIREDREQ